LHIEREHQEINEMFTELEKTDPDGDRHRELWSRISALLRQDVRDEEDTLLPKLQAAVSRRKLVVMGLAWEAVRRIAPTRPHPVVAPPDLRWCESSDAISPRFRLMSSGFVRTTKQRSNMG
jgi:hypothetical protein